MRGVLSALVACVCISAAAAPGASVAPLESVGLRSIAGWLKVHGADGFLAADVADAIGIPRESGAELIAARSRGYRDAEVLRIAQLVDGQYLLFVVQAPGEVYFYLSTVRGGLRKAVVASRATVTPLEATEAELNFGREVLYWEQKVAR
ncbi:MAG TPA: hypothetical protein VLI89_00530 [Burkholderiales bacterium]|jgi:hypothetical protein|nr:hypothetical protein [Burkholderiales bacterium]